MSPFSSGEWWLLPFLHSHLRLQQPGQQHSALSHPSHGSHEPPQLHRQEEEQEEGPQELMYENKSLVVCHRATEMRFPYLLLCRCVTHWKNLPLCDITGGFPFRDLSQGPEDESSFHPKTQMQ